MKIQAVTHTCSSSELRQQDQHRCAHHRMERDRNAVQGWLGEAARFQLLDHHPGKTDISVPSESATREFGVVDVSVEIIKGTSRDHLNQDGAQLFGHLLVNEGLGLKYPQQPLIGKW